MRFKKIYVEITNVCNLNCSFCKKTLREPKFMSVAEFERVIIKIKPFTSHIFLHVLGEPLLHKDLGEMLKICCEHGIKVNITTNGTLISKNADILLNRDVRQINFSLHDLADAKQDIYLNDILSFSVLASKKIYINLRLWNYRMGIAPTSNSIRIIKMISDFFSYEDLMYENKKGHGIRICDNIFLQIHEEFEWPKRGGRQVFETGRCYALRDHVGILADGTVVPCCLDSDGDLALGNIFDGELEDIINSQKALLIFDGFKRREVVTELCKTCGFAAAL